VTEFLASNSIIEELQSSRLVVSSDGPMTRSPDEPISNFLRLLRSSVLQRFSWIEQNGLLLSADR